MNGFRPELHQYKKNGVVRKSGKREGRLKKQVARSRKTRARHMTGRFRFYGSTEIRPRRATNSAWRLVSVLANSEAS
jgi:hypothetical protein